MSAAARASVEDHVARLRCVLAQALGTLDHDRVPVAPGAAAGRIAAARVSAAADLPGVDNSQMDGFALRASDVRPGADITVAGLIAAGSPPRSLEPGEALGIMTGAPLPAGADCVVPVERTSWGRFEEESPDAVSGSRITISAEAQLAPGTFIRPRGSDVVRGDVVVEPGTRLTPAHLGLLAACGVGAVEVLRRPTVMVLATGDEVRPLDGHETDRHPNGGAVLAPGHVYDANTPLITATLEAFGCRVVAQQVSADDPTAFLAAIDHAIARFSPQLVVTAGGISMGAFEVVRQGLSHRGIQFGSVAQQPGGPQGWGVESASGTAIIALPGNPVSCAVSLETLVRPALAAVYPGCRAQRRVSASLAEAFQSPAGVRQFRRVQFGAQPPGEAPSVHAVGGPGSHLLAHLARADALLELREEDTDLPAGTIREVILLTGQEPR